MGTVGTVELGYIESLDCEIYPIYTKSDIYEGTSIVLYYVDRKFVSDTSDYPI